MLGGKYSYKPTTSHRSGLEDKIAEQIKASGMQEVYEKSYLPYVIPASNHKYTPDFILANGIIIEAKGVFERTDRQKHLKIKEQYPNLDIRFVFQNPHNKITKGSKTTYADWCIKNGYQYATKLIPALWFKEKKKSTSGLIANEKK